MSFEGPDSSDPRAALSQGAPGSTPRRRRVEIALSPAATTLTFSRRLTRDMEISNCDQSPPPQTPLPPTHASHDRHPTPPSLSAQQRRTIDNLLNACTDLQQQGEDRLSQLVDRIGMTMMQQYLARAQSLSERPSDPSPR